MLRSLILLLLTGAAAFSRQQPAVCGTNPERWNEELFLHRQLVKARHALPRAAAERSSATRDAGNIVIMDDSEGVVARRNDFNLDHRTLAFTPTAAGATRYQFQTGDDSDDRQAAAAGSPLTGLDDDDSRPIALPFSFPFFGASYRQAFVNSDGNVTFVTGDSSHDDRSLGRLAAGPPRIAPLFSDLDPSAAPDSVRVLADAGRVVVSWVKVPQFSDFGAGAQQTFQLRLFPSGRIEMAWSGITTSGAVTGISPGQLQGASSIVSFFAGSSTEFSATIAERFGGTNEVDILTVAQRFYQSHDDAYDYLVIYNNLGVPALSGAVAYEQSIRSIRTGYGRGAFDFSSETGSRYRLQALMNMGPLSQYPLDPNDLLPARRSVGDTGITVLAHEAGHLFLAYASVKDPNNRAAKPMLGYQLAHWNSAFNSEASLLEGNRIQDNGPGANPRFSTVATVEGYAPLDQYLMGFRAPEEVPPTFLVNDANPAPPPQPRKGVTFNGSRRDVAIDEIIQVQGRRIPDYTVSQRHFRFAFILIVAAGSDPTASDLAQLEAYRTQFEPYYQRASAQRATADTLLRRSLQLSVFPAAGVVQGSSASGLISIQRAADGPLAIHLSATPGIARVPDTLTIPAGATSATFTIDGLQSGVAELSAQPSDGAFEIAYARLQVAPAASLKVVILSGDKQIATAGVPLRQPVSVRVTDINNLPYPGARVAVADSSGGSVAPSTGVADASGVVSFQWTPGAVSPMRIAMYVEGTTPASGATVTAIGSPAATTADALNAASFAPGLTVGGLASLFGTNLAGGATAQAAAPWPTSLANVQLLLNGQALPLTYVSDTQINFLVPASVLPGTAELFVQTPAGASGRIFAPVNAVSPGIFFESSSGFGAVLIANTAQTTATRPARRGEYVEIYCTGLGTPTVSGTRVSIGGHEAEVTYSGLASGYLGLYQVNAKIPDDAPSGIQVLSMTIEGSKSNEVKIAIE